MEDYHFIQIHSNDREKSKTIGPWLDENIKGNWIHEYGGLGTLLFWFENEEDAMAFKLWWS